jgi:hypothetical protein
VALAEGLTLSHRLGMDETDFVTTLESLGFTLESTMCSTKKCVVAWMQTMLWGLPTAMSNCIMQAYAAVSNYSPLAFANPALERGFLKVQLKSFVANSSIQLFGVAGCMGKS